MVEYLTEVIVLDKRPDKNLDAVFTVFSRDLGKVYGKATSSRKITSKLASHLEPGTLAKIRLARKSVGDNFRIVEALAETRRSDPETIRFLMFLDKMAPALAKDEVLFMFCREVIKDPGFSEKMAYRGLLKIIGLDPDKATCAVCGSQKIAYFSSQDIMFLCRQCGNKKYGY
ncbi:MAG TPA: recombination protein O N-terminal domain-containing protein [Candidatus Colwellbacteria bacterium]|jgi:DNA repair protein RecO|nr:recombination protein O N-terminal domain-containing protein [Candidatus Colwellbacteria bacterium]